MNTPSMKLGFVMLLSASLLASCQDGNNDSQGASETTPSPTITLADVPASPEFPDAKLGIKNIKTTQHGDSVKVQFMFNVQNYELKAQTDDAANKGCNNSAQGQHIHFIMDNAPYIALYEPTHEITLPKNSDHYLMAFLSRSYHESLKNKDAAVLYHFRINENGKVEKLEDPSQPMVFYSRPKGDYLGNDIENLLLDFYVWNATLGEDALVKARIETDGIDTTFHFSSWKSTFIQNLPEGKVKVTLTLTDGNGNRIEGPMTEVTREVSLAKQEPLP